MPINSRQKGAQGEREWAKYLSDRGYPAHRGRQFSGSAESPDVRCDTLGSIHWEVKRVQNLSIREAITQAIRDAGNKIPIVAHRRNGEEWLITLSAQHFVDCFIPGFLLSSDDDSETSNQE